MSIPLFLFAIAASGLCPVSDGCSRNICAPAVAASQQIEHEHRAMIVNRLIAYCNTVFNVGCGNWIFDALVAKSLHRAAGRAISGNGNRAQACHQVMDERVTVSAAARAHRNTVLTVVSTATNGHRGQERGRSGHFYLA